MNVFELYATLGLDTTAYDQSLDDSEKKASTFGNKIGNGLKTGAKVAGAGLAVVGASATLIAKKVVGATSDLAEYGDSIDKNSQKIGVSSKFYQEWEAVLQHSGTSMGNMSATFKTLTKAVEKTNDSQGASFEKLGLSVEELQKKKPEEVFEDVVYALQGMEEGNERTAIAMDLLGRGAQELGPLLNTSAEDTQAMIDKVNELGGVIDGEGIKNSAKYQDTLQDMKTAMGGLTKKMSTTFLPSVTKVMDGLTDIFAGRDSGLSKLSEGVSDFANNMIKVLPKVVKTGLSIVKSLASAIIENIPQLAKAATDIITDLVKYVVQELPALVTGAISIVKALAQGITDSLPELIPAIVDTIGSIVDALIDNSGQLLDAAIEILIALGDGLINSASKLLDKVPTLVRKLVNKVIENAPKLARAALRLVKQLAESLIDNAPKLIRSAIKLVKELMNAFIDNAPKLIKSGLKLVRELVNALIDNAPKLIRSAIKLVRELAQALIDNAPKLIRGAIKLVRELAQGLIDHAPKLLRGAVKLVRQLVSALIENAPKLLKAALKLVTTLVSELFTETNIKKLFNAGKKMVVEMAKGVKKAAPEIVKALTSGLSGLIPGLNLLPDLTSQASEQYEGLKKYITDNNLLDKKLDLDLGDALGLDFNTIGMTGKQALEYMQDQFNVIDEWFLDLPDIVTGKSTKKKSKKTVTVTGGTNIGGLNVSDLKSSTNDGHDKGAGGIAKSRVESVAAPVKMTDSYNSLIQDIHNYVKDISVVLSKSITDALNQLLAKDLVAIVPNKDGIFEIVRQKNNEYVRITGNSAF